MISTSHSKYFIKIHKKLEIKKNRERKLRISERNKEREKENKERVKESKE